MPARLPSPMPCRPARRAGLLAAGLAWVLTLASPAARAAEDIIDVLRRSQTQRLEALQPADAASPRASVVQASFDRLVQALPAELPVALQVVQGGVVAETVHGHIVVASEALAQMPEPMRLFILAHEIGHVALRHWEQTALLYQKWIPGEVRPETTDPVAPALGREASALAHQHEYAADGFAARLLLGLGVQHSDLVRMFQTLGTPFDTATHPGSRKRLAALRAVASD